MDSTTQKISLMSDPRVFRGSVAARQREERAERERHLRQQNADERYRTEIIRNRLSSILNNDSKSQQMATLNRRPLARLAGPIGHRAWSSVNPFQRAAGNQQNAWRNEKSKILKKSKLPTIASGIGNSTNNGFKNVSFVPVKPLYNVGMPGGVTPLPQIDSRLPITQVAPTLGLFSFNKSTEGRDYLTRRRLKKPQQNDGRNDPPPSAAGLPSLADVSVQTEEKQLFEDTFNPLIFEMVESAILEAQKSLLEEDDIKKLAMKNRQLQNVINEQIAKNEQLNLVMEKQNQTQKEIELEKGKVMEKLKILESRKLAEEVLDEVLNKSFDNKSLKSRYELETLRTVATDTRTFEKMKKQEESAVNEIKSQFFPFVYAKAEQIYVHKLADSYLIDALFSNNSKLRDSSKNQLNEQIEKYKNSQPNFNPKFELFNNQKSQKTMKKVKDDNLNSCKLSIDPLIQDYCTSQLNDLF